MKPVQTSKSESSFSIELGDQPSPVNTLYRQPGAGAATVGPPADRVPKENNFKPSRKKSSHKHAPVYCANGTYKHGWYLSKI